MPFEEVTEVSYTTAATAKGGRGGHVKSADGVVDLPLGPPGSRTNPKANPGDAVRRRLRRLLLRRAERDGPGRGYRRQ